MRPGIRPSLVLRVEGVEPGPQGSKKAVGRRKNGSTILVEMSKKVKPFREAVADSAKVKLGNVGPYFEQHVPVDVEVWFYLKRGKTVTREFPTTSPDLDKVMRSLGDALKTGGVVYDDAQVIDVVMKKRYATPENPVGCLVFVHEHPSAK